MLRPAGLSRHLSAKLGVGIVGGAVQPMQVWNRAAQGGKLIQARTGAVSCLKMQSSQGDSEQVYDFLRQPGNGKKVLVAGGAGYIGTHLCADLLMNDYEVCIFDNFANSSPLALERVVCPLPRPYRQNNAYGSAI